VSLLCPFQKTHQRARLGDCGAVYAGSDFLLIPDSGGLTPG